jgi:hypothetical protein
MSRNSPRTMRRRQALGDHARGERTRDDARREVAYIAARLMAEDGITDYGQAKQKAARQAGLQDTKSLPDNAEIEAALREYQALYQGEEHEALLFEMRECALKLMQLLAEFDPRLTGSVLDGTATEFSAIELELFTDSGKDVELYLINRNIPYETGERSRAHGGAGRDSIITLHCHYQDVPVTLIVHPVNDLRVVEKRGGAARGRADAEAVAALLEQTSHDE